MLSYPREFFDLQWRYASRVAALAAIPLEDALLAYTNFYARFGLGRAYAGSDPTWRAYIEVVRDSASPMDSTWAFYLARGPDEGAPGVEASVGCFSYARLDAATVRLHFHDAEVTDLSPLAACRVAQRRAELRELFEAVIRREGAAVRVVGNSWLYNLPAYRRLFPEAYLATARPSAPRYNGMPLWGQFLARRGRVREDAVALLFEHLDRQVDATRLAECFAYLPQTLSAPATCFV